MDIIISIISKIGELLVEPTGRQLGYLFCYEANIKSLEDDNDKLKNRREDVQKSIDAAMRNSKVIGAEVKRWVAEVDNITKELEKFLREDAKEDKMCLKEWCPNLKLQHSLGRKAKKYTEVVLKLQEEGKPFAKLSYPVSPQGMHFSSSSMKDFNSRKKILNQVMEALRNEKVRVTAICGMGGIGKTTMAKEVVKRATDEKLFCQVVMVTVSQNPGLIQDIVADLLGLKFDDKTKEGRANRLRQHIWENKENILVILDDLWNELDLESVGIPDGCKILFTSRDKDVCEKMKSEKTFAMEVLSDDEAWTLFEEVAGISNCTRDLHKVAKKVANECKGLPIAIVTVGSALKNREEPVWKDALLKLKKLGPDLEVFNCIKLSYDYLENKEEQKCFLLCCLFPEDYDIGIETLARYGKGLRLFEGTDTTEEARNRVYTLVQKLKRCFLLMDGDEKECVKMHDIIRDVAISIAKTKEHGGFIIRCANDLEEWPEIDSSEMEECTAISLVCGKIKKHPDSLVCPKLKLLSLSSTNKYSGTKLELGDNFFEGIKEIKVLAFQGVRIHSLPASLPMLQNLRTLHLEYCALGDISIIGGLKMLEILSLIGSKIQEELPKEIGNLQHLKALDVTECRGLKRIPPGVLSRLTTLEELKILWFKGWSSLEGNEEKTSTSLDEITPLLDRYLKVLRIYIPQMEFIPRSITFKNLTRFLISVNRDDSPVKNYLFGKSLILGGVSTDFIKQSGIHPLVKKCEDLDLEEVYDLKNLFPHFDEEEQDGFPWLRTLQVDFCKDMEYVVKFTSNKNRTDLQVPNIFPLLEKLVLLSLDGLKGIFHYNSDDLQLPPTDKLITKERISTASSLPGGFPQLDILDVENCPSLEEIVSVRNRKTDDRINTSTSDDMIFFPKLTLLTLVNLPSLISLCRAIDDEALSRPPKIPPKDADGVESSTDNMNTPTKILFPFKCIKWLPSLANLEVKKCNSIKVLFSFLGDDSPQLAPISRNITNNINVDQKSDSKDLSHKKCCLIGCLPCSSIACKPNIIQNSQEIIHTSHLTEDGDRDHHVDNHKKELPPTNHQFVTKERISTASSLPRGFPQLQYLFVHDCASLEEIVSLRNHKTDDPINTSTSDDMILFPKLTKLALWDLPSLISLCRAIDDEALSWPPKDADGVESSTDNMNTPTKILFPFKCIKWLPSLAYLEVTGCHSIKVLFSFHGDDSPQLAPINRNITNNINVDQKSDSEDLSHKKCCLIGCLPCSRIARKPNIIQNSQEIIHTSHLTEDGDRDHHVDNHKEEWLKNLEELDVSKCVSLEVIFDYGGDPLAPALNKLKILELNSLQKLMDIWKKVPQQVKIVGFKNLKTLSIKSCPSLRYLFTASIAKLLVMLESLKVANCESMEEVVAKTEEEINNVNAESYAVSFPHLVSIKLNSLDNLYYFCQQPYAFEFPSLETLQIRECPKLQTFVTPNKTPNIPKLKVVNLNGKDMEISKQNLNGTIRH